MKSRSEMAAASLLLLTLIKFAGAAVYSMKSVHEPGHHFIGYDSLNASDVTGDERAAVISGTFAAGSVIVSMWSSVFSDKAIEIDISNHLTNTLNNPTWFMLHGYAAILPPFLINGKEPSTKFLFEKNPDAAFGTEGVVSYQIGSQGTFSLVIMWKMPQILSSPGFFIETKKGGHIPAENLETMFHDVDDKKLWFIVENQQHWQTRKEEGFTWKAAMGTRSVTSLKVVISQ